jgi:hypothetical protein
MKKLMLSVLFVAFATTATIAQTVENVNIEVTTQQEKTAVKLEDLPDAVKATLSGDKYAEWVPSEASVVTTQGGVKHFEVTLKKDDEVKVINLGEDGKKIEAPAVEKVEAQ